MDVSISSRAVNTLAGLIDSRKQARLSSGNVIIAGQVKCLAGGHGTVHLLIQAESEVASFKITTVGEQYLHSSGSGDLGFWRISPGQRTSFNQHHNLKPESSTSRNTFWNTAGDGSLDPISRCRLMDDGFSRRLDYWYAITGRMELPLQSIMDFGMHAPGSMIAPTDMHSFDALRR
jgi:hypothetical protein